MKSKRSLLKTIFLIAIRYDRWKMNPRNFLAVSHMQMYKKILKMF